MASIALLLLILAPIFSILAQNLENVEIIVNTTSAITFTDDNFICATIDWWPQEKCDYNQCPWGSASVINLDLTHPLLAKAIRAFGRLRIRIGGSLQDQVIYDVGNLEIPCHPFFKMRSGLFGFSKGCLHMKRWDELNRFFRSTGVLITFGLNALYGRHPIRGQAWAGHWVSSNARDFIQYTISKGYQVDSWEFGNELSGEGVAASVDADLYGKDLINLKAIIDELYQDFNPKPSLIAPGGFYDKQWFSKLLQVSGPNVINVMTHHLYNLGAGVDPTLSRKILNPHYLDRVLETFISLKRTIETDGSWASAWVGESGGAYNSGGHHVSDTFIDSFWYLDQLGMAAKYSTKVYCRQTLIGGNYGLLNKTTFLPNPDYYSALLWHRLMGNGVLDIDSITSPYLRSYAHCTKGRAGVTLLLINLSNTTHFRINVRSNLQFKENTNNSKRRTFVHGLKKAVSWFGSKSSDEALSREEYHLTPLEGNLHTKTMVLNGTPLDIVDDGEIPILAPELADLNSPLSIAPLSIKFVVFPNFNAPCCR